MSLSLTHLRILAAVGEAQSISHAARTLGISQPAVSKSIRTLEGTVGVQLVISAAGGSQLTEAGQALFAHARTILDATDAAEEEIASFRRIRRGILRIGASTTIARYYLPQLIAEFQRRHPEIEVRVTVQHTRFVARLLIDRELEVAVVEAPVHQPQLVTTLWQYDEMIVVVAPGHALTKGKVTVQSLEAATWILREQWSGAREFAIGELLNRGAMPRRILTADCNEVVAHLALEGAGAAVVARSAVERELAQGKLLEVRIPGWSLRRPLNRLSVAGRRPGQLARVFDVLLDATGRPQG